MGIYFRIQNNSNPFFILIHCEGLTPVSMVDAQPTLIAAQPSMTGAGVHLAGVQPNLVGTGPRLEGVKPPQAKYLTITSSTTINSG